MVALGASAALAIAAMQISAAHAASAATILPLKIDLHDGVAVEFDSTTFNMTTSVGYCQFWLN